MKILSENHEFDRMRQMAQVADNHNQKKKKVEADAWTNAKKTLAKKDEEMHAENKKLIKEING